MTTTYNDFKDALAQQESSGNFSAVNGFGYIGLYQFGEAILNEIGFYVESGTPNYNNNDWSGTWTTASGVSSYDEFLGINSYNTTPGHANAISAQNDAINEEFELKANQLINNGWGVYEGQTLNGHEITMSGMLAYIHLVGYGNFTAHFLTSGGTDDPQDGNNIPGSQYLDQFAGYDTPFTVDHTIAESMHGGSGEDVFTGHEGNDTIDGRDGDDTYIFNPGDGKDIIIDGDGQGVLIFDGVSITGTAEEAGPNFEEYILENGGVTFTIRRLGADVSIVNSESSDEIIVKSIP